jgi:hypothetical protein
MNRDLSIDLVQEYAGSELTESEAQELFELCVDAGIRDEFDIVSCDERKWNQLISRAVCNAEQ